MLSAACLPQVWAEALFSLQASWERSKVRWPVRSMFGEQTFVQLWMGFTFSGAVFLWYFFTLKVNNKNKQVMPEPRTPVWNGLSVCTLMTLSCIRLQLTCGTFDSVEIKIFVVVAVVPPWCHYLDLLSETLNLAFWGHCLSKVWSVSHDKWHWH